MRCRCSTCRRMRNFRKPGGWIMGDVVGWKLRRGYYTVCGADAGTKCSRPPVIVFGVEWNVAGALWKYGCIRLTTAIQYYEWAHCTVQLFRSVYEYRGGKVGSKLIVTKLPEDSEVKFLIFCHLRVQFQPPGGAPRRPCRSTGARITPIWRSTGTGSPARSPQGTTSTC